ncbi:MAG: PmoA family protein [Bacteroidota bacterium]
MIQRISTILPIILPAALLILSSCNDTSVQLIEKKNKRRVEVLIDGKVFTAYIWPATTKKPVLYPIKSATGEFITRGFPLDPRPDERVDHPHQVGHWLNYGNVNGIDFWNNSYAIPLEQQPDYGEIIHNEILEISGGDRGVLAVRCYWVTHNQDTLLKEITRFVFSGDEQMRAIDRITTLKAMENNVTFHDTKEGMLAIRMDRAFEFPTQDSLILTDPEGIPMQEPTIHNVGVTGQYRSSEGITGSEVWGTRAKWMELSAIKNNAPVSVVIFDHPENPGYPAYWHARTYGLFSANPLGVHAFSSDTDSMNYTLQKEESVTFRYKIVIQSPGFETTEAIEEEYKNFIKS